MLLERYRESDKKMRPRQCVVCGVAFTSNRQKLYCEPACQQRSWRAAKMLEGTHEWVKISPDRRDFKRKVDA